MTTIYPPVTCQLVGNLESYVAFHSDLGRTFFDRERAIAWGIEELGHDDFRIATLTDGRLTAIGWGLTEIARQLGYKVAA